MEIFEKIFEKDVLTTLVTILIIIFSAFVLVKFTNKLFKTISKNKKVVSPQMAFSRRIVKGIIISLAAYAIMMQIKPMQQFAVSALASSGIAVVVLGFAAQEAMSNIIGGMFISLFKPFSLGDRIRINEKDIEGIVEDISLRHTILKTFENNRVVVPNSIMNTAIIENSNLSENKVCKFLDVKISYSSDVEKAMEIIAHEAKVHKYFYDNRNETEKKNNVPPVVVRVLSFNDYNISLRAFIWAKSASEGFEMISDILISIKKRFDEVGMEISYPYMNILDKR